jgi:hypothetical protein
MNCDTGVEQCFVRLAPQCRSLALIDAIIRSRPSRIVAVTLPPALDEAFMVSLIAATDVASSKSFRGTSAPQDQDHRAVGRNWRRDNDEFGRGPDTARWTATEAATMTTGVVGG